MALHRLATYSDKLDDLLRRVQKLEARAKRFGLPPKPERIEARAKDPDLVASTPLETGIKRGTK